MGRPIKEGIAFFCVDVGYWQDDGLTDLCIDCGAIAEAVYFHLLAYIYSNGYFVEFTPERVAKNVLLSMRGESGLSYRDVMAMLDKMAEIGLLDKSLMDRGVFTSKGIQKQYYSSTIRRKERSHEYWLLREAEEAKIDMKLNRRQKPKPNGIIDDINPVQTELLHAETPVNDDGYPQNKNENENENERDKNYKCHKGGYPGQIDYFTSWLLEDGIITERCADIPRFNALFENAAKAYPDLELRLRVFRYVKERMRRNGVKGEDCYPYFAEAFERNLSKMEGYDERIGRAFGED